jgi:hypothetical protein
MAAIAQETKDVVEPLLTLIIMTDDYREITTRDLHTAIEQCQVNLFKVIREQKGAMSKKE